MIVVALIGAKALGLLFVWLASAIAAEYLSERKGYGAKPGLASGLLLSVLGVALWLVWPARPDSRWKLLGPLGKGDGRSLAQLRAEKRAEGGRDDS